MTIGRRLIAELAPRWLRIGGYWYPRGGIPIDVFFQTGAPPEGCSCPTRVCRPIAGAADRGRTARGAHWKHTGLGAGFDYGPGRISSKLRRLHDYPT